MAEEIRHYDDGTSMLIGGIATPLLVLVIYQTFSLILGQSNALLVGLLAGAFGGGAITTYLYGDITDEDDDNAASGALAAAIGVGGFIVLFIGYELVLGGGPTGNIALGLIAAAFLTGVAFVCGFGGDMAALWLNERRLANAHWDRFETTVADYRQKLDQVEGLVNEQRLDEAEVELDEARTLRGQCEHLKDEHDISESLWSENQRYAEVQGILAGQQLQPLLDEARDARDRGDLDTAIDKMGDVYDLASEVQEDASTYDADIDLPITAETTKKERATMVVKKKTDEVDDRLSRAAKSVDSGDISTATSHLETARSLVDDIKELEAEHGISAPSSLVRDIDRQERQLIEDRFESLLDASDRKCDAARTAVENGEYDDARRTSASAIDEVDAAAELAADYVYLGQTEIENRLEKLAAVMIDSLSKRVAEINDMVRSQTGQDRAEEFEQELEEIVHELKSLHKNNLSDDTEQDIVIAAGETQKVLLAARLLKFESRALTGEQQFNTEDYGAAKNTFEDVVDELEALETNTPEEAIKEYETELDELTDVCETNAERARKLNLGFESGLRPESPAIIGPQLRSESSSATTSDTNVFDPNQVSGRDDTSDTEVFSPSSGTSGAERADEDG